MSVRAETLLDGRYLLSDRLAVGGMGEVWRGSDEELGRAVAVKILRAELAEDDSFRKRFRAEAKTAASLPHQGIAAVYDYGETTVGPDGISPSQHPVQGDGIAYLVMELVPGEPLSSVLHREGSIGTERTLSYVAQAAHALQVAHERGVVHRDVKPANLMVTPDGIVKITDFGIARPNDHEPLTMTGQVMGTAHYLAPELARGLDASPLSDVYALGVVAYECLAGHRPFEGENQVLVATAHLNQQPPPLPGTVPPDVVRVVSAAMEKDPQKRIRSAEAFGNALDKLAARDPSALDEIGGARPGGGLGQAQAPQIAPGGGMVAGGRDDVPRRLGRHGVAPPVSDDAPPTSSYGESRYGGANQATGSASSYANPATRTGSTHPGQDATSQHRAGGVYGAAAIDNTAATTNLSRPAPAGVPPWAAGQTSPEGLSMSPPAPPYGQTGGEYYYGSTGESGRRRSSGNRTLSPAMIIMLGLLGVVVVLLLVIRPDPGGLVDLGTDPSPSLSENAPSVGGDQPGAGSTASTAESGTTLTPTTSSPSPTKSSTPTPSVAPTKTPTPTKTTPKPATPTQEPPPPVEPTPDPPTTEPTPTVASSPAVTPSPTLSPSVSGAADVPVGPGVVLLPLWAIARHGRRRHTETAMDCDDDGASSPHTRGPGMSMGTRHGQGRNA